MAFTCQGQDELVYCNGLQNQRGSQNSLTHVELADIWNWLADHGVPKNEIERKPTKFLLDMYNWKHFRSIVESLT